jgi:adenylate kinase
VTSRLVLFGPPGAGKGTQAAALSASLSVPHISTGDIFRGAVASGTALGLEAKSYLDKGELVPDGVVIGMIRDRLTQPDTQQGWLLDGFPRTVAQAHALDELLQDIGQSLEAVLNLQVTSTTLVERLLSRGRQDDSEAVIRRRLEVYQRQSGCGSSHRCHSSGPGQFAQKSCVVAPVDLISQMFVRRIA